MARVEKISVAVTPEMVADMREAVESGEYASASEVMRDALRGWRERRTEKAAAIEEIGRLWDEGMASGPLVDGEEAFARLRNRIDQNVRAAERG